MLDWLNQADYIGLFLICFVGSTLITAPSDIYAVGMVLAGRSPWLVGLVGLIGGFLGNLVNYAVGRWGARWAMTHHIFNNNPDSLWQQRAGELYRRYGAYSLLLNGLPLIGDPITVVAGGFGVNLVTFCIWVVVGKILKFVVILGIARTF